MFMFGSLTDFADRKITTAFVVPGFIAIFYCLGKSKK
jgi:hypothetical protein